MAKKIPKIEITKHPEFKVIYVSGAFGALKPDEGFEVLLRYCRPENKVCLKSWRDGSGQNFPTASS